MNNQKPIVSLFSKTMLMLIILWSCLMTIIVHVNAINYGDALSKSILFFEGQRSGKLPSTQRMTWRKDSALSHGFDNGVYVDLTGGYYDAGDNVKYNFPMAFTTTMLAWGVLEYGKHIGEPDLTHALEAIQWSTDYFLKSTATPGVVYAQVGDPNADHNCWERPEDMDTPPTVYAVNKTAPGSEVAAEISAALAASSLVFKVFGDKDYAKVLLKRASEVFEFADTYRGSYNDSIGFGVCPFYCDFNGYQDELLWAAAWLHKATKKTSYWNYVMENRENFKIEFDRNLLEFGWDAKPAGINVLVSKYVIRNNLEDTTPFMSDAEKFVCSVLPESPFRTRDFTPGGLLTRPGGCNLQHIGVPFILLAYTRYIKKTKKDVQCGDVTISSKRLVHFTKSQVDYILGDNPMKMSYMVGFGENFPQKIHHRGSSLPSISEHPEQIECKGGTPYFLSENPNPNLLIGAVVGGPDTNDSFADSRMNSAQSEPTTYVNAPLVGLLAYFKGRS